MSDVVNKLWGFCHTLRHDGIDYGDYIEQLTYLLFLKMADEPKVSKARIFFLESLGLIEEIQSDVWGITPRGRDVLLNGKPALFRRLRWRWKTFEVLEEVLRRKYKARSFNAAMIAEEEVFKKADSKKKVTIGRLQLHLRWMRSLGVIEAVSVKGMQRRYYRLSSATC